MVDLVDIGLMNSSEAWGRRRLNDTMRQLSDAISTGIHVDLRTTTSASGAAERHHVTVTSLRRCDHDVAGCSNASVVAERLRPAHAPPRPRAVMTSSNDTMTSSSAGCRTVVSDLCLVVSSCFLSLMYLLRLPLFTGRVTALMPAAAAVSRN